jgi:hypothetical protein
MTNNSQTAPETVCATRIVRITCTGTESIDFRKIHPMQGSLKIREKTDIDKIIKSIIEDGFSFPFFIWKEGSKNYALDGHGRIKALTEMSKRAYVLDEKNNLIVIDGSPPWEIPPLPTTYIEAADINAAKKKLLKLNSRYGTITEASFNLFTEGLKGLDLRGIAINFEKIEINPPSIAAPLHGMQNSSQIDDVPRPDYQPNLEPDISTTLVSEAEIEKADGLLESAMLHKGEVETIELRCPVCTEPFSVRVSDMIGLIEEVRR